MGKKSLNVDGVYLNNLRFADDIVLLSTDIQELHTMLNELNGESVEEDSECNKREIA